MKKTNFDEKTIIEDYSISLMGIEAVAIKNKVGKKRVKEILTKNNIPLRDSHFSRLEQTYIVSDWSTPKYVDRDGYHWVAIAKDSGIRFDDIENRGGHLTAYINDTFGIEIPTLYDRRKYYQQTGNYWWEQWFNVVEEKRKETKKCPYCNWTTEDIENKSGAFEVHLRKAHNKTREDYLKEFPEDIDYFNKYKKKIIREKRIKEDYVICPICGKHFIRITRTHLEKIHNIKVEDFRKKYPNITFVNQSDYNNILMAQQLGNLSVSKNRFISSYEKELRDFLTENNISFEANRQILIGKEIDILIENKKLGIEFDGLKWHTEIFGHKPHRYHLEKTLKCNEKGYKLIHIFEDEYVNHKEIVYNKLKHLLGIDDAPKIGARKCVIKEILKYDAEMFLNKYHIQGYTKSTVYLGAFYQDELIAVMSFKNGSVRNDAWELNRFATSNKYICQGIGGKLFKWFLRNYNPEKVISFADRRWTLDRENNLYTHLGFTLEKETAPDYRYYNEKFDKYKRVHKMSMSKSILAKKYGYPLTMTEYEMAKDLGYDRIWDCGLFKYVWYKEKESE